MNRAETYVKAAAILDLAPALWKRWYYDRDRTCFCITGAVAEAMETKDVCEAESSFLHSQFAGVSVIQEWNDHPSTTKDEAVLFLLFLAAMEQQADSIDPQFGGL